MNSSLSKSLSEQQITVVANLTCFVVAKNHIFLYFVLMIQQGEFHVHPSHEILHQTPNELDVYLEKPQTPKDTPLASV